MIETARPASATLKAWRCARRRAAFSALLMVLAAPVGAGERVTLNLNPDWKFIKADPAGAEAPAFDDAGWTTVSTPHTYNDVDTFDDWSLLGHRGEQNQWGGRTWYRKRFTLPEAYRGKKVYLEFEAARQVAEVYLNGQLLGVSKTGFTPFGFDLTSHLRFGEPNVLAVMCDNRFLKDRPPAARPGERPAAPVARGDLNVAPPPSPALARMLNDMSAGIPEDVDQLAADQIPWNNPHWHPAHGGLYRNVRLYVTDPLHISLPLRSFLDTVGPYAYATEISSRSARLSIEVPIQNGRATGLPVELVVRVLDPGGATVLALRQSGRIAAAGRAVFTLAGGLRSPKLWEPDHPNLYRVVCSLRTRGELVDSTELPLGIRSARWDKDAGLFLNGRPLKLHGWGQKPTDEWPGLGAAQPDWIHFLTLQLMRDAGGNFVRWGHCAGGPASIAAGDRLGIIADQPGVDGEADTVRAAWKLRVLAFRDLLVYFRNNPSILIWEGGNQKVTREHAQELKRLVLEIDPHGGRAYAHRRADQVTAEFMDLGIGTEGGREIKNLAVVEGEYDREESPRRVWDESSPPYFGYPEAKGQTYQLTSEQYAASQVAHYVKKLSAPDHAGGANWIFSDSTSGGRVAVEVARASGEVDGVRLPKEAYYVCQVMFRGEPAVHIVGHWSYPAGTKKAVFVASNTDEVELFVNGRSLGRATPTDRYLFSWKDVAFEQGAIKAVGYAAGKAVAMQEKRSADPPVALRLTPITGPGGLRADGSDVLLVDVEAVDAEGRRSPTFQQRVDFELSGPGLWRGGYNSGKAGSINHMDLELEAGINRVAVRSTLVPGAITLRAASHGLTPAALTLASQPFALSGGYATVLPSLPAPRLEPPTPVAAARSPGSSVEASPASAATPSSAPASPAPSSPASAAAVTPAPGGTETRPRPPLVKAFSYSGPTRGVAVQPEAGEGKRVYVDGDERFATLPAELRGADYVQAAQADSAYSAADLIEISFAGDAILTVAHDDRLPRPEWLDPFRSTGSRIEIAGRGMSLFERRVAAGASVTLGGNADSAGAAAAHMYLVFVRAPAR